MIDSFNRFISPIFESIVQLKSLRAITLCPLWNDGLAEIPETIGGLIHLRYLDLSGNRLEELPSAMGSLYNLQTLRLVGCKLLGKVDVRRLINMRHLYVGGCERLELIEGIEKLTHLQRLDEFPVRGRNKLEYLKDLKQFQGSLTIQIYGLPKMADNAAIMVNKPHLLQMELDFISADELSQREIMDGLQPHACLESLYISWYEGGTFSHWLLSLHSLRVLILRFCPNIKTLPLLGKLASLESLRIHRLDGVSKVGVEFLGIEQGQTSSSSSSSFISFPKLKQLNIWEMESWEEWEGVEEENYESITIMPCLSQLEFQCCRKLKALPDFLWKTPLQKLKFYDCPLLQDLYTHGTGEEWAKISHIPTINIEAQSEKESFREARVATTYDFD